MSYEIIPKVPAGSALVFGLDPSIVPTITRALREAVSDTELGFSPQIHAKTSDLHGVDKADTVEIRGLFGDDATITEMASRVMALSGAKQEPVQE